MAAVLEVRNLVTQYRAGEKMVNAVDDVSFDLRPGETVGIVGESGSGKTATIMSVLNLVSARNGRVSGGEVNFDGEDLLQCGPERLRALRGGPISMVFQDALTALNPMVTVGKQLTQTLAVHSPGLDKAGRRERAIELLRQVRVPSPEIRFTQYPNEFSGGMRQRAMIALAIANRPKVLLADEPTTALDVTTQAQVLELLHDLQQETGMAMVFVTHDLGVVATIAERVMVMYAGRIVETGPVDEIFANPRHPYTRSLLRCIPHVGDTADRLTSIKGSIPTLGRRPGGCAFHTRCPVSAGRARCAAELPLLAEVGAAHRAACHFPPDGDLDG